MTNLDRQFNIRIQQSGEIRCHFTGTCLCENSPIFTQSRLHKEKFNNVYSTPDVIISNVNEIKYYFKMAD